MSLGKMVLMVYELLENCLERKRLPMYFAPDVDLLEGSKLDAEECLKVARMMTRLFRDLYERDYTPTERERDFREEEQALAKERMKYGRHDDFEEKKRLHQKRKADWEKEHPNVQYENPAPIYPLYLERH